MSQPTPHSRTSSPIARMLSPRSVAVAGVSAKPGSLGGGVLANLERSGFKGDIHLIHPTQVEIGGRRCVPSAHDLPEGVDCVVLAIPGAGVLDAVKGCAARGVGGVIIFSAGFAEAGAEGEARQRELAQIAAGSNMAIAGPNCLGFVNNVETLALTFSIVEHRKPSRPGLAVVSQSGAMASVVRAALDARDVPVAITVSTGNEAVTGAEDFIEHLLDEAHTAAIAVVAEQIRQPKRFLELAAKARTKKKPIVLLHPGRSKAAQQSAITHTGAMTGDWEVMRTLVTHAGVALVETMDELIDVCEMLIRFPRLPSKGPVILGESGAFKAMVLDLAEQVGLDLPQPTGASHDMLSALAPGLILPTNPVDLTAQPLVDPQLYTKSLPTLVADDTYGSLVVAMILSSPAFVARKAQPILEALEKAQGGKPTIFAMLGEDSYVSPDVIAAFRARDIPFVRSPDRVVRARATVTRLGAALAATPPNTTAPNKAGARLPPGVIPEHAAKTLLRAAGLPVPEGALARSVKEGLAIANEIGFPVALKAQSAALSHKSDAGGVVLHLSDAAALEEGWARLLDNIATAHPGMKLDGVLVECMAPKGGLELILGARNDPQWGPVLAVGLGGVQAEALGDIRLLPPLLALDEIAAELHKLKAARLLGPFRGTPARDVAAAAQVIAALGRFVVAHPQITEVDINPLVLYPAGQGVLALDALVVVA